MPSRPAGIHTIQRNDMSEQSEANEPRPMPYHVLESAVMDALRNSEDLERIADELMEVTFDAVLDDGIAKNLPIVAIFRNIMGAASSYSNYLLTKKLTAFLRGPASVPQDQRRQQLAKLMVDTEYRHRVGENLML